VFIELKRWGLTIIEWRTHIGKKHIYWFKTNMCF
jgi:hypothetical protein